MTTKISTGNHERRLSRKITSLRVFEIPLPSSLRNSDYAGSIVGTSKASFRRCSSALKIAARLTKLGLPACHSGP